jgi:DNA-directed RNA polymerase specialized sigma24 family protein
VADWPPANDDRLSTVTHEELRAYLCRADVQRRIREVVRARLGKDAPKQLAEDIAQDANVTMLSARALPRSMATADGWVSALARRAVVHHFRRGSCDAKWLDPEGDVDALPADGGEIPRDGWLISAWLAEAVQQNARDEETLELLVYQARTGKKYHEVAADHAITSQALKSRVHEFKKKYEPRWRRRQAMYVLIALLGAALVAIAAALVWLLVRPAPADIRPDPSRAVPSATLVRPPQTPPEIAKALRDAAEKSCAEELWGSCNDELDEAKKLDPAGESEERVQRLRGMIRDGTTLRREQKGGGKRP